MTGYGMGRAPSVIGSEAGGVVLGRAPEEQAAARTVVADATRRRRRHELRENDDTADVMDCSVHAHPARHVAGQSPGPPTIYGLRYVTRSPDRVSVRTIAPLLSSPVALVPTVAPVGSTNSNDRPVVPDIVPYASRFRPEALLARPVTETRPVIARGKYGDE